MRVWRSVQVWLPRVSTSAGQSAGGLGRIWVAVCEGGVGAGREEVPDLEVWALTMAAQAPTEVQLRQL